MPIHIAIVEDQEAARETLVAIVGGAPGYCCVGAFESAEDALNKFVAGTWDIALVDIQLPGQSGLALIRRLKAIEPTLRCLVLTVVCDSTIVFEAIRCGADGYLLKNGDPKHLLTRLGEILAGEVPMSPAIARRFLEHFRTGETDNRLDELTGAQRRVLLALAGGASNKELAESLGMSEATVRSHLSAAFRKLRLNSRAEAVAYLHSGGRFQE